jgi:hypothetical protein
VLSVLDVLYNDNIIALDEHSTICHSSNTIIKHPIKPSGFVQIHAHHNGRQFPIQQSIPQCTTITASGRQFIPFHQLRCRSYMRPHPRRRLALRAMPTTDSKHEQIYAPAVAAICLDSKSSIDRSFCNRGKQFATTAPRFTFSLCERHFDEIIVPFVTGGYYYITMARVETSRLSRIQEPHKHTSLVEKRIYAFSVESVFLRGMIRTKFIH